MSASSADNASAARQPEAFPALSGTDLAGVTPLRPGLQDTPFQGVPANDAARSLPRPLAPWLIGSLVLLLDVAIIVLIGVGSAVESDGADTLKGRVVLLVAALTAAAGLAAGAYDHGILFSARRQLGRVLAAGGAALAVTLLAAAAFGALERLQPTWLAVFATLGAATLSAGRILAATFLQGSSRARRRTVVLGSGPQVARLVEGLRREPAGLELIGQLSAFPVELRIVPDLVAEHLADAERPPVPPLVHARPISGLPGALKTAVDYVLAAGALVAVSIPMLLVALAVKLDSPGPVFFRQRRTGFNDRSFEVFKFRTMYVEATDHEAARQVRPGDPRVTRVGAILRRTSLDELPQLLNVLRGEMSFVGPRPHAPGTRAGARRFDEVVANYAARHRVKPGLTGLAQVRGYRGPTPTERQILLRVESDLEYIARWSLWLDFCIILRTLLIVVRMRNAH